MVWNLLDVICFGTIMIGITLDFMWFWWYDCDVNSFVGSNV